MVSDVDEEGSSFKEKRDPWISGGLCWCHNEIERPKDFVQTQGLHNCGHSWFDSFMYQIVMFGCFCIDFIIFVTMRDYFMVVCWYLYFGFVIF